MEPNLDARVEGYRATSCDMSCEQTTAESGQMCRQNESSEMSHACSVGEYMAPRAPEIHLWDGMEGGRQC